MLVQSAQHLACATLQACLLYHTRMILSCMAFVMTDPVEAAPSSDCKLRGRPPGARDTYQRVRKYARKQPREHHIHIDERIASHGGMHAHLYADDPNEAHMDMHTSVLATALWLKTFQKNSLHQNFTDSLTMMNLYLGKAMESDSNERQIKPEHIVSWIAGR